MLQNQPTVEGCTGLEARLLTVSARGVIKIIDLVL
jgi:hypothetical protein